MGVFALICVVILGVAGYWRYANQLPTYPPPAIVMPECRSRATATM